MERITFTDEEAGKASRLGRHFGIIGRTLDADTLRNNVAGVFGEFALSKHLYGTIEPAFAHRLGVLNSAIANNFVADGGCDLPGINVDVKTAVDKRGIGGRNLHLLVKPSHVRMEHAYVFAVVGTEPVDEMREVELVGWCDGFTLEPAPDDSFAGWHRVKGAFLSPLSKFDPAEFHCSKEGQ